MPTALRAKRRLSWLTVNIFLNIIAASVIALYESTLSAVIALAIFLPIVSDMSGCSGNQAVAVSMRELSLCFEMMRQQDLRRVRRCGIAHAVTSTCGSVRRSMYERADVVVTTAFGRYG